MKNLWLMAIAVAFLFQSCENEDSESIYHSNYSLIYNEGGWGKSNASIDVLDENDSIHRGVYFEANQKPLGDVLQSVELHDGKLFMVLNASNKIEIAHANNFKQLGTVTGLDNPREVVFYNNKGYVSQWNNYVAIFDVDGLQVTDSILVGVGPEGMLVDGSKLFVANSGGYVSDSTISVIDLDQGKVIKTIQVHHNPVQIVMDADGHYWVLCVGVIDWTTYTRVSPSKLVRINSVSLEVDKQVVVSETDAPINLVISGDGKKLYVGGGYTYSGIHSMPIDGTSFSPVRSDLGFYGFNVHPETSQIYATYTGGDFANPGKVYHYTPGGIKLDLDGYSTGIAPKGVVFVP